MRRISGITIGLLCAVASFAAGSATVQAGTFTMKQCSGSKHDDFQGLYGSVNGTSLVDVVKGCSIGGRGKIGVYQDRSGPSLPYGAGGQFKWVAAAGTEVIGAEFSARLNDANHIAAQLRGFSGGSSVDLDGGAAHDGSEQSTGWSDPARPRELVVARIVCHSRNECANAPGGRKAFMEVTDVEFTVRDTVAPEVTYSGELRGWIAASGYHRGSASVKLDAVDRGSGIAASWVEVNGLKLALPSPDCPGDKGSYSTRFTPCPLTATATENLNTAAAPFQEGPNLIRFCARDYASPEAAASRACTPHDLLLVDNRPSAPPVDLRSDQGPGWQPRNGFTLRWEIPAGQAAPVIGAVYLVHDEQTGQQVGSGYFPGPGRTSGGPIEVPEAGAYRVTIHLLDGALNLGAAAHSTIRFDDRPPGDVEPEAAEGWISRDELPITQRVERAEPGGPSGISGYALAVAVDGPSRPCETVICLAPEVTLTGGADSRTGSIGGLAEGEHWISAVAVSGASRSSLEPGSTMVQVDRTPPESEISGVPNQWVNHPVVLTVQASDRLSGMQPLPGDRGEPKTIIAAGDYADYESPGPFATFAVATEGVNKVRYWAEDLAGNANDGRPGPGGDPHPNPGQAVVRIDTTAPLVWFDPLRDPDDPELVEVRAEDTDSGVAQVSIGIRRAGTGEGFSYLPTTGREGSYAARIPSDDLPRGAYELSAKASDRAGNEQTGSETPAGEPMILTLPLKAKTRLSAHFGKRKRKLRIRYGKRAFVAGRLTSGGSPLPNRTVRITGGFVAGSRGKPVIRKVVTDGDGRYRLRLRRGPSRSVSTYFAGSRKLSRAAGARLRLRVRGKVRFRFKPRKIYNGGAVRMKGSVGFRGALPPARGKLVAIQYFDPGRRSWRPVAVLRTDRRGRFRYTYRFRTISSAQRIIFRAGALPEAGWPYLPSTSKPRSVIVYPQG